MLIDLSQYQPDSNEPADVIVVGSGAVGLTLAVTLARSGKNVLVIEAGSTRLTPDSQAIFNLAQSIGRPLPGLHIGRFRMWGGTTNFWGGQLVEFDPIVFQHRPWAADVGWPIEAADLSQFYSKVYSLLGMKGLLGPEAIWAGIDKKLSESEAVELFLTAWAPQANFASLFKKEIKESANLLALVNAPVTSLELDPAGDHVTKVHVRKESGEHVTFSAKYIVLANGTVEIARLLSLPLADGRYPPWANNEWLGRGFMDHVDGYAGDVVPIDKARFHQVFDNFYLDRIKYVPKMKMSEALQERDKLLGVAAHFIFRSSLDAHVANVKNAVRTLLRGGLPDGVASLSALRSFMAASQVVVPMLVRYVRSHRMYNLADSGILLRLTAEQSAGRESSLVLLRERDTLGLPIPSIDWKVSEGTLESMATFAENVRDYLEHNKLADVRLAPGLVARDQSFLDSCDDANHQMGMVRMAIDATNGVVDRNLKVFKVDNLFVAGAAVFPSSGFANPTLTAMALGLRLADYLVERS